MSRRIVFMSVIALSVLVFLASKRPDLVGDSDKTDATTRLANAKGVVDLFRDDWGVPHIYAKTEADGFFGLGYALAEDRPERFLRMILFVTGRRAEIEDDSMAQLGFGSTDPVESDYNSRMWRHAEESRAGYLKMSAGLRENYAAFANGFNRYMETHPVQRPSWTFDLEPWHLVALSRGTLWNAVNANGVFDCLNSGAEYKFYSMNTETERVQRNRNASNQWTIAPWRTSDRAAIFLSDPHGGVDGGWMHEYRIDAGDLKSAGYALGALLLLPHTRYLTWGMTTGGPDVSDCYAVKTDKSNPNRYLYDGEWTEFETVDFEIKLKDGGVVIRTADYTRHNGVLSPVIHRDGNTAFVVSTPYMHDAGTFDEEIYKLNHAKDIDEAKAAMEHVGVFKQNVMFADHKGNIWYLHAGRAPIRDDSFDWTKAVDGSTSATQWKGIHPLSDLIQVTNPPHGYMQNNNVSPDTIVLEGNPIKPDDYPRYIFDDFRSRANARGVRSSQVLSAAYDFGVDDAINLALDEKWVATEIWQAALKYVATANADVVDAEDDTYREFLSALLGFDGFATKESSAALKYYYWREALWSSIEINDIVAMLEAQGAGGSLSREMQTAFLSGIDAAMAAMLEDYGSMDLVLGDVFRITRGQGDWPLGGAPLRPRLNASYWDYRACSNLHPLLCENTLRAYQFGRADEEGKRMAVSGSRLLRLVSFTDPIKSFTAFNYGQSDVASSPHFDDQAEKLSSARQLKAVYFEFDDLASHVSSHDRLSTSSAN